MYIKLTTYIHYRVQNTEYRTHNAEHRTQNTEYRTQNTEHRTQNTEQGTQNTETHVHKTSHGPLIDMSLYKMLLMRANPLLGQVGEDGVGP
jgi:hypothetical protein